MPRSARLARRGTARRDTDAGFSLVETLVSLAIIATTTMVATVAFVHTMSLTRLQGEQQGAVQFAADVLDNVLAIPYAMLTRHTATAGDSDAATALAGVLDTTAAVASATENRSVGGLDYRASWYASPCTRTECTLQASASVSVPMLQVAVAVTWPAKECADRPGGRCVFTTATLINPVPAGDSGVVVLPTAAAPTTPAPAPTTPAPAPTTAAPAPGPVAAAVWANTELSIKGSTLNITGRVHSNRQIAITGSTGTMTPVVEYGVYFDVTGSTVNMPAPVKVAPDTPVLRPVADYRPGGTAALAAGEGYKAINCNKKWSPTPAALQSATVIYVPCAVEINSGDPILPLIVAEGPITVDGVSATIGDYTTLYAGGLISNGGIVINASSAVIYGNVQAYDGEVTLNGSSVNLHCGVIGKMVVIASNSATITFGSGCTR